MRALTNLAGRLGPLFGISVLLILAAGLYMALTAWSLQTGWIAVALIGCVAKNLGGMPWTRRLTFLFSLGSHSKQAGDKRRLT